MYIFMQDILHIQDYFLRIDLKYGFARSKFMNFFKATINHKTAFQE